MTADGNDALLVARGVSKCYRLRAERSMVMALAHRTPRQEHWALRELDFEVRPGEVFAVIGRNGAGKSTLLKLAAGVTHATHGTVTRPPRVAPLIEVGAGFHPDLSGRENVEINARLLGLPRREVARRFDDIVGFAELEHAIDRPIREFSSGMFMRLGFSVAIHTDPQVLVVDEVLAVGDAAFQVRCLDRIKQLRGSGVGVLFVSHNEAAILDLADRALLLDRGAVAAAGDPRETIGAYHRLLEGHAGAARGDTDTTNRLRITDVTVLDESGGQPAVWEPRQRARVRIRVFAEDDVPGALCGIRLHRDGGGLVAGWHSPPGSEDLPPLRRGEELSFEWDLDLNVTPGTYVLELAIARPDLGEFYAHSFAAPRIPVAARGSFAGTADINPRVRVLRQREQPPDPAR